ncbi:fibronectin type III domain-containing protein [Pararcticibacter amylolyticus]|nr:hypothetical protein [Pararcticibacter amylolyticus]
MKGLMMTAGILILVCLFTSCSEFIEESIEDETVHLNAPADSAESNKYLQSFWWDPVEYARSYRIQIVRPSFDHAEELILDSLTKDAHYSYTLEPGTYQWRVRAENSGSKTGYSTHTLIVHEASLGRQQVQLKSPANGLVSNQPPFAISWYSLYGSTEYLLQIDRSTGNFANEQDLLVNTEIQNTEYSFNPTEDRSYIWRVKAKNDTAESKWSAVYSFAYDGTPPSKVSLRSPVNAVSVSSPVTLQWDALSDAKKYQLNLMKSDSSPYGPSFPVTVTGTSYVFTSTNRGEQVLWQVRAIDAAGNVGPYSDVRNFTVQ